MFSVILFSFLVSKFSMVGGGGGVGGGDEFCSAARTDVGDDGG